MNSLKSHVSKKSEHRSLNREGSAGMSLQTVQTATSPPYATAALNVSGGGGVGGPRSSLSDSNAFPYEKLERVGKGSFGEVYKGINLKTQNMVAIKIVDLDVEYEPEEFQTELALLAQCFCGHVVKYYGAFLRGTQLWIIMDYCGGGSVREALKLGPLDEATIAVLAREILHALIYLHNSNIIHRDIKAANVLLTDSGHVKLCDFGVAGQISLSSAKRNTFVGTPYWMAPEVIQHSNYDFKADIWSLGITIYEMAVGDPPYAEKDPLQALFIISKAPPAKLEGKYSSGLKEFIGLCLHDDPKERPSAEELLQSRFIRSAKKGTGQLKLLVDKHRKWKERQKAEEHDQTELIRTPLTEPINDREFFGEALRKPKHEKHSARFSKDGWDFSMPMHRLSFNRSSEAELKSKRAFDVSKIKARPLKMVDSQKQLSMDHDRHASKGVIVIPSSEGSEPIKRTFQDDDFREANGSVLFKERLLDETTSPSWIDSHAGAQVATSSRERSISNDQSPPEAETTNMTTAATTTTPMLPPKTTTTVAATTHEPLPLSTAGMSHRGGGSIKNPFGLISLSSRSEPRFAKSDSIKSRKERRKERNASYQSLASLDIASRTFSMNNLPSRVVVPPTSTTLTGLNPMRTLSLSAMTTRNLTIEELLKTPCELPPLSLDAFVKMEPVEFKETLGTAAAQAYQLLCEIEEQLKLLDS